MALNVQRYLSSRTGSNSIDTDSTPDADDNEEDDDYISSSYRARGMHHCGMVGPTCSESSSFLLFVVLDPERAVQSHGMERIAGRDAFSSSLS
jgi:hypothetical protein